MEGRAQNSDLLRETGLRGVSASTPQLNQIYAILCEARRYPRGVARADLMDELALSRAIIDSRIETARRLGLLRASGRGASTGGRAPELWAYNADAGTVLALSMSYRTSAAALVSLDGTLLERRDWETGMIAPPEEALARSIEVLEDLASCLEKTRGSRPWAVGAALPTPVDFRDGSLIDPVASSDGAGDWVGFPLRRRLSAALGTAVWVDDEVNAMALAAATRIGAPKDLLYVRLSLGTAMGIVSGGTLHRGAGATSGEIGHIQVAGLEGDRCRCGRRHCLETKVGGRALESAASTPAALAASPYLRSLAAGQLGITMASVYRGAATGDRVCARIVTEAAEHVASVLAVLATAYNPAEIVIGGEAVAAGPMLARILGAAIRRRVLPVTAERMRVRLGEPNDALHGIGRLVADRLLSPHQLTLWAPHGSPAGVEELITQRRQDL